jgi:predicted protein tyrosine phosphatase
MSNPFEIYSFDGFSCGQLAICPEPTDQKSFDKIRAWGPDTVVTMITVDEFTNPDLAANIANTTQQWMQAAVADFGAPESDFSDVIAHLLSALEEDGRVLIHCKGGQGRSGMLAMRLLVEQGEKPVTALKRIRDVRPGAVETKEQEIWASQAT